MIHYVYYVPSGAISWYGSAPDDAVLPSGLGGATLLVIDSPLTSDDWRVTFPGGVPTLTAGSLEDATALAIAKKAKLAEMRRYRDMFCELPAETATHSYENTESTRAALNTAILAHEQEYGAGTSVTYPWDGTNLTTQVEEETQLTLTGMKNLLKAMNAVVKVGWLIFRQRKASIEAATTIAQVNAITWGPPFD